MANKKWGMWMVDFSNFTNEQLIEEKKRLEAVYSKLNNEQLALKYLMNGEYGALGNIFFRYYDIRLASAVTLSGQLAIRWIEKELMNHPLQSKFNWKVVYSDTDSIYLNLEFVAKKIKESNPELTEKELCLKLDKFSEKYVIPIIDEGYNKLSSYVQANENRMFMKREKISPVGFWVAKKKYALMTLYDEKVIYDEPTLKVKGIETVRSSTPKIVKKPLENVLKLIMNDNDKLAEFIAETKTLFYNSEPEDIAFSVSVNTMSKYVKEYEDKQNNRTILTYKSGTPIGVRAAITYNSYIRRNDLINVYPEIHEGDKIKYLYLKLPNPFNENILGFPKRFPEKDKLKQFVDYRTQFEKSFMSPIERITTAIKIALKKYDEVNLNDFFDLLDDEE